MGKTSIEWTDESINPIRARLGDATGHYCEKISPGCKNCYASRLQPRFRMPQFQEQRRAGVEPFLDAAKLEEVLRRRKPTRFFWCDMTDMFGAWVPNEWIAACFAVMAATPQHTHQVLTKRADRLPLWFEWLNSQCSVEHGSGARFALSLFGARHVGGHRFPISGPWPLPNVHLGVSAEDQATADERIPHLLEAPAAVRFVSAEPLLGPIELAPYMAARLDWVIVGGESGTKARPFDLAWGRSIVSQCRAAGVPVFVKQLGAYPGTDVRLTPDGPTAASWMSIKLRSTKGGDPSEWPADLRVREMPR